MYLPAWKIIAAIVFMTLYTLTWLEEHKRYNSNK